MISFQKNLRGLQFNIILKNQLYIITTQAKILNCLGSDEHKANKLNLNTADCTLYQINLKQISTILLN